MRKKEPPSVGHTGAGLALRGRVAEMERTAAGTAKAIPQVDTAATPADWVPYKARRSFNLYELACLLNRQDPERLIRAVTDEYLAHSRAIGLSWESVSARHIASMVDSLPDQMLGDAVGNTLRNLKKATGKVIMNAALDMAEAQRIVAALGMAWPPELPIDASAAEADGSDAAAPAVRRVTASAASEAKILKALAKLGLDPLALPPPPPGKQSPAKQQARKALQPCMSKATFNKAWQRLHNEHIRYRR